MILQKPAYTMIPNMILDEWMRELSGAEFKVLIKIARNTLGWSKTEDGISLSQLSFYCGLSIPKILDAIKLLLLNDVIQVKRQKELNYYSLKFASEADDYIPKDKPSKNKSGFVYFILNKKENAIKIGKSKDADTRFKDINSMNCNVLELLGYIKTEDMHQLERTYHVSFAKDRLMGEWFKPDNISNYLKTESKLLKKVNIPTEVTLVLEGETTKATLDTKDININKTKDIPSPSKATEKNWIVRIRNWFYDHSPILLTTPNDWKREMPFIKKFAVEIELREKGSEAQTDFALAILGIFMEICEGTIPRFAYRKENIQLMPRCLMADKTWPLIVEEYEKRRKG